MKKLKRIALTLLSLSVVFAMMFSLAACGNASDNEVNAAAESGLGAANSFAGVELRFLDTNPGAARQAYYEKVFGQIYDEFGIKVVYESCPSDDAAEKVMVMAASDDMPDILTSQPSWIGSWVANEYIVPITDYVSQIESNLTEAAKIISTDMNKNIYNDVYVVPDGLFAKAVFIRADWAEEAGLALDYDWTYDDYFTAIMALTDPATGRYGLTYRGARGAFEPIMFYLQSFTGGNTYADDGTCLLRNEECLNAFKRYLDLYLDGYAPKDSINWGFTEMCDNFVGGLTGTILNDPEVVALCQAGMQDDQWKILPVPHSTVDGKIYNLVNASYSYSISSTCKNTDAAWTVINYLLEPSQNIEYCKLLGAIPVIKNVGEDPFFGPNGVYGTFVKELDDPDLVVVPSWNVGDFSEIQQGPLHEEIQRYLLGEEDVETCFNNICDMLESVVQSYLAEHPDASVEKPMSLG